MTPPEKKKFFSIPFKNSYAIGGFIVWNGLFLYDIIPLFLNGFAESASSTNGRLIAFILLFFSSLMMIFSPSMRTVILKENQEWNPLKRTAYIILFISLIFSTSLLWLNNA
ncbi:hypothetical protein [Dokdonia sp.]|uniref:hypothetical protein n=1 Tax=Dokdonia sp. TaxID=2024995 RepID=UPI0032636441